MEGGRHSLQATVRRESLLQDGFEALGTAGGGIKGRVVVQFVSANGCVDNTWSCVHFLGTCRIQYNSQSFYWNSELMN